MEYDELSDLIFYSLLWILFWSIMLWPGKNGDKKTAIWRYLLLTGFFGYGTLAFAIFQIFK